MTKASSAPFRKLLKSTLAKKLRSKKLLDLINSPLSKIFLLATLALLIATLLTLLPIRALSIIAFYLFGLWAFLFLLFCLRAVIIIADVKLTKPFLLISLFTLLATFAFYSFTLINSKQIYTWDQHTYYGQQLDLLDSFGITSADGNFLSGLKTIIKTTFASDYGDFLLSFTSAPFSLTPMTAENFIFTYSLFEVLPTIFAFLLLVEKALELIESKRHPLLKATKSSKKTRALLLVTSALALVAFPLLHKAASYGQPDIFGLFWVALIAILCLDYFFDKPDPPRWLFLVLFIFFTIITRRWYLFLLLAFFLSYGIAILAHHKTLKILVHKKSLKKALKPLRPALTFLAIAAVSLLIALLPFIIRTLKANYSVSYAAWNTGGLAFEITSHQIPFLGGFLLALIILGFFVGILNKITRTPALIALSTLTLSLLFFTHVQNLWYHQSLILVPAYLSALFFLIVGFTNTKISITTKTIPVLVLTLNYYGALSENPNFYNNHFFGNISLKPIVHESYDKLVEIDSYILENTITKNADKNSENAAHLEKSVYPNFASSEYSAGALANLAHPDRSLDKVICKESSIDNVHGFPTCILSAKYVIISSKNIDSTGATPSKTIPKITELFTTKNPISAHYKPVKTFTLTSDLEFTFYERTTSADATELDFWQSAFSDDYFPAEKFADRIKTYQEENL